MYQAKHVLTAFSSEMTLYVCRKGIKYACSLEGWGVFPLLHISSTTPPQFFVIYEHLSE
jgi:hypothetical protein